MTRDNNKKTHYVVLGGKGGGQAESVEWDDIQNKPEFATVATSGSYNDLTDKPEIPSVPAMVTQELTFTLEGGTTKTIEFYTVPNYFYVEDVSGSNNTLSITNTSNDVYYSTDKSNWTLFNGTATIPANGKLYLKANINSWEGRNISASGNHNIGGNIMSLLYSDNFEDKTEFPSGSNNNFYGLFAGNTHLISAANLIFPATTLTDRCYNYMFGNCTSLATAPAIFPATTLTYSCYGGTFEGCTSLTTAPVLPATTLAERCYEVMFCRCASLTQAPELPASTLNNWCYRIMFEGCTSLTTAPVLPATTLADYCYYGMFNGCTNINTVTTYAQTISATDCLYNWLNGVSSTGTFYNLGGATYPSGASGIPTGWTEHTSL